ncbi:hypothetical protein BPAE_0295g00150 [Botrytis paeoniae]|uniref:Uncharacterized protein n=1 Tax=Botrytis paeoniae TaxID=278948 RepID=A0A4Z1FCA7_9HELO|nr:hypothetical protein BPAE_0295g00150 [Botrytis paeoniae]
MPVPPKVISPIPPNPRSVWHPPSPPSLMGGGGAMLQYDWLRQQSALRDRPQAPPTVRPNGNIFPSFIRADRPSAPAHDAVLHAYISDLEEKLMAAHRLFVQRSKELEATPPAHKDYEARKATATSAQEALSNMPPSSPGDMELDDGASHPQTAQSTTGLTDVLGGTKLAPSSAQGP